jgi:hypothetical protein
MKKILAITFLVIFSASLYGLTIRGISGNPTTSEIRGKLDQRSQPLELSPERGRYILIQSLIEDKSFSLNEERAVAAFPDIGYHAGKFYIFSAPGLSILALPLYQLAAKYDLAQLGAFATVTLFAIINLLLIFKIGTRVFNFSNRVALFSALVFAFASTSWSYAITLYQHHITTAIFLSTFLAAWQYSRVKTGKWIFAAYIWLTYGLSVFIDLPNVLLILPSVIYLLIASVTISQTSAKHYFKARVDTIIASLLLVLVIYTHAAYNQALFGNWKTLAHNLIGHNALLQNGLIEIPGLNSEKSEEAEVVVAKKVGSGGKATAGFFKEDKLPNGLYALLFSNQRGLFIYAPIFILSIIGIYLVYRRRLLNRPFAILLTALIIHLFIYSSWGDPWGGWAFGPRYLIPSMAILSLFMGVTISKLGQRILVRLIAFSLFAYSSFIALLGALTTNGIPPKIEALQLDQLYTYALNFQLLQKGESSSLLYNIYASNMLTFPEYFAMIYAILIAVAIAVLFINWKHQYDN